MMAASVKAGKVYSSFALGDGFFSGSAKAEVAQINPANKKTKIAKILNL